MSNRTPRIVKNLQRILMVVIIVKMSPFLVKKVFLIVRIAANGAPIWIIYIVKNGLPAIVYFIKNLPSIIFPITQNLVTFFFIKMPCAIFFAGKKKIISFLFASKINCIRAFEYVKIPLKLGSFDLVLINPLSVVQGTYVLSKFWLWDRRILKKIISRTSGAVTIGWRPAHVILYVLVYGYCNWNWNLFNEEETGFARGNTSDEYYFRRYRKQRIRQPGEKKNPQLDKWVPGSLGARPKWKYFKSLRLFLWFLSTWY